MVEYIILNYKKQSANKIKAFCFFIMRVYIRKSTKQKNH